MTTQKYKFGDEILVRAIFKGNDNYTNGVVDDSKAIISLRHNTLNCSICTDIDQIYSLAPEFNYGEEIEVSDDQINWRRLEFVSCLNNMPLPKLFIVNQEDKILHTYRYARKIKPKQDKNILMFEGKKYKLVEE